MPREVIARRREEALAAEGGPALERREEDLNVEWGKPALNEYYAGGPLVNVPDEVVRVTIRQETQLPHDNGRGIHWDAVTGRELYSAALTRKEVNKLIATLRRARDQVFGTDA